MADFTMYDREREFKWQIECQLSGGTNAYIDAEDIYSGRLTRQISSGEGIEVGSCYVSELDLTIVASALPSNVVSVKPYFRLLTSTEIVEGVVQKYYTGYNLGVFKIASTKRKEYGRIDLVCYDKMADLDTLITPSAYTELLASDWRPFYLLDWIATKVNVTYTFTQAGIEAMPNGTLYFKLAEETSNIKTYRDLLQYVCMLIGAYGIFDEDGHLNVKTFADVTSYSLPASFRFSESFGDVPIVYSGVELTVKNATTMFGNANNTVVRLSDNPFLYNLSTLNQTTDYATFIMQFLRNIYTEFQGLSYYAGEFEIPPDASLNVGRLLAVSGGGAVNTLNCFLQKIDVNFDGRMSLSCGNPNTYVTRTQNRTTSSITNLTNRIETLENSDSGKEVYTSTADPSITDGNNDNVWFKYTLQAGLKFDNGAIYPDKWHYMGCFRGEYTGYGEGWCYIWANNYPIPQDVNTGEGYVFPFQWYDENRRVYLGIRCHKDRYEQIVDTAAVTFYVISKKYPLGQYFTGQWMYCDMDANYQRYLGIKAASASTILWGAALLLSVHEIDVTRQYVAIDGVSTLTNIAKRTNAEWVKINGEWVLVSEDIGSEVVVTPTLTEGTEIGEIEVSGNSKKLYAPTPQSVSVTQTLASGTEIAEINIGDTSTKLYAPTTTVTQTLTEGTEIGEVNGTKLYAPTGGGSTVTVTPITTTGTNIANIAVDGTTYNLFAPTSGGSYAHHYSTTEQVVGTWIDGKPIYEKTYEFATPLTINSTSYIHSGITPANIKSLIGMPEIIDTYGQSAPIIAGIYTSNKEIALAALNTVYGIDLKYLTVRYTKTTD